MLLYLVRHGEAKSKLDDPLQPLSEKGKADVQKVADNLANLNLKVETIYHSAKSRAKETAEIIYGSIGSNRGVEKRNDLNPLDNVYPIVELMSTTHKNVMLVGHLPYMSILAATLTDIHDNAKIVSFYTATVLCLQRNINSKWEIKWKIVP